MARIPSLDERDEFNQLTAITLALQLLERRSELSERQHALVRTALQATDRLSRPLLERGGRTEAPSGPRAGRAASAARRPARARR